jgi:poly-gamma-glutamate synthesis protein (capsule biosynthesis protein)
LRIVACGDAIFSGGNLANRIEPKLLARLRDADASFVNAEFTCPRPTTAPMPRRFITALRPEAIDELTSLGFNLVSFANNHTGDFGMQGVVDTIEAAEARGLPVSGIGRSLDEARLPRFLDTPKGRIGLVSISSTRSAEFAASVPGVGIPPRPGLNPLRWGRAYVLPDAQYRQLQAIDEMLGSARSRAEINRVEVVPDAGPDRFQFGSLFEGSLRVERGEHAHVRTFLDERDAKAILTNIRDAANRSECVLLSFHTHEGTDDNWYSPRAASFVEDFARRAIDAGASAVFGHGPHMLRGIEIHKGKPIFYSLNSILMEYEAGEQRITPEMYEVYGFAKEATPSEVHMSRARDKDGNWIGFYAESRFSRSCVAICDFGRETRIRLVPVDLDLRRERPADRGLPAWASPELGREIAADLAGLSQYYGTTIRYDERDNMIEVLAE